MLASVAVFAAFAGLTASAQNMTNKKDGGYHFSVIKAIDATDVQNQNRTGTCWSFSALSFYESELLRLGKGKVNLSEMFVVRNAYLSKAEYFVRFNGKHNFGPGGASTIFPSCSNNTASYPKRCTKASTTGKKNTTTPSWTPCSKRW